MLIKWNSKSLLKNFTSFFFFPPACLWEDSFLFFFSFFSCCIFSSCFVPRAVQKKNAETLVLHNPVHLGIFDGTSQSLWVDRIARAPVCCDLQPVNTMQSNEDHLCGAEEGVNVQHVWSSARMSDVCVCVCELQRYIMSVLKNSVNTTGGAFNYWWSWEPWEACKAASPGGQRQTVWYLWQLALRAFWHHLDIILR